MFPVTLSDFGVSMFWYCVNDPLLFYNGVDVRPGSGIVQSDRCIIMTTAAACRGYRRARQLHFTPFETLAENLTENDKSKLYGVCTIFRCSLCQVCVLHIHLVGTDNCSADVSQLLTRSLPFTMSQLDILHNSHTQDVEVTGC
jgi:hypothetical protein